MDPESDGDEADVGIIPMEEESIPEELRYETPGDGEEMLDSDELPGDADLESPVDDEPSEDDGEHSYWHEAEPFDFDSDEGLTEPAAFTELDDSEPPIEAGTEWIGDSIE
jgi:hypothetical protein